MELVDSQALLEWFANNYKNFGKIALFMCSGPCILRPHLSQKKYSPELKVVLKWRDIYIENVRVVSLMAGLKMEGS